MIGPDVDVLCWNVRGLNQQARKDVVHQIVANTMCAIACFQETKLAQIDDFTASYLGGYRLTKTAFAPAIGASGTRGGLLILWDERVVQVSQITVGMFHLSASISLHDGETFRLSNVYGPSSQGQKRAFLQEMLTLKPSSGTPWIIMRDFNLIYRAADKNNSRLNTRMMSLFREAISDCELQEIPLQNRHFTWSNEQQNPTLVRLDRMFCNTEGDALFASHALHALSTSHSDHCPLLLSNQSGP